MLKRVSVEEAHEIIETREPKGKFWTFEGNKAIGIDNSYGDAWTNEFDTVIECKRWLVYGGEE